jgi:hypothetical protein
MFGGCFIEAVLDMPRVSRPRRALIGWALMFIVGVATIGRWEEVSHLRIFANAALQIGSKSTPSPTLDRPFFTFAMVYWTRYGSR